MKVIDGEDTFRWYRMIKEAIHIHYGLLQQQKIACRARGRTFYLLLFRPLLSQFLQLALPMLGPHELVGFARERVKKLLFLGLSSLLRCCCFRGHVWDKEDHVSECEGTRCSNLVQAFVRQNALS